MSHAGDATDPFEAVKGDIAQSKDLVASATEDLRQHDRWFRDYLASETRNRVKRARQLERRRAQRKRLVKRQHMVRTGKRLASAHLRFARAVSLSLLRSASSALLGLRRLLLLVIRWLGPKVQALSLSLVGLLLVAGSWISAKARVLSLTFFKAASASSSWVALKTSTLARSLMPGLSAGASWIGRPTWHPRIFTRLLQGRFGEFLLDRRKDGGSCALAYAGAVGRRFLDWSKGPRARTRAFCGGIDR